MHSKSHQNSTSEGSYCVCLTSCSGDKGTERSIVVCVSVGSVLWQNVTSFLDLSFKGIPVERASALDFKNFLAI